MTQRILENFSAAEWREPDDERQPPVVREPDEDE